MIKQFQGQFGTFRWNIPFDRCDHGQLIITSADHFHGTALVFQTEFMAGHAPRDTSGSVLHHSNMLTHFPRSVRRFTGNEAINDAQIAFHTRSVSRKKKKLSFAHVLAIDQCWEKQLRPEG